MGVPTILLYSQVFPNYTPEARPITKNSALAKIKAKRAAAKAQALLENTANT